MTKFESSTSKLATFVTKRLTERKRSHELTEFKSRLKNAISITRGVESDKNKERRTDS